MLTDNREHMTITLREHVLSAMSTSKVQTAVDHEISMNTCEPTGIGVCKTVQ